MDDWTKRHNRLFIGLKYFVVNILGLKGTSYDIINQLESEGYIETYLYEKGITVSGIIPIAIKILKPLSEIYNVKL